MRTLEKPLESLGLSVKYLVVKQRNNVHAQVSLSLYEWEMENIELAMMTMSCHYPSLSFSGDKYKSHLITITPFLSSIFKCICYICCIKWLFEYEGIEGRKQFREEYKEVEKGAEEGKQAGGGRIKKPLRECTCRLCCNIHVNELSERITQFSQSRGFSNILWSKVISGCVPAWKGCLAFSF